MQAVVSKEFVSDPLRELQVALFPGVEHDHDGLRSAHRTQVFKEGIYALLLRAPFLGIGEFRALHRRIYNLAAYESPFLTYADALAPAAIVPASARPMMTFCPAISPVAADSNGIKFL